MLGYLYPKGDYCMKTWENPTVEELRIMQTQHGGTQSMNFDYSYLDSNGALHVTFEKNTES